MSLGRSSSQHCFVSGRKCSLRTCGAREKTSLLPKRVANFDFNTKTKRRSQEMYVLQVNPYHLMTWHFVRVNEKGCIQIIVAHASADLVHDLLVLPLWELTTMRAEISLLPVEFDVVVTVFFEWLVTKYVVVESFVICGLFSPWPRLAELITHSVASKHIRTGRRNTLYIRFLVMPGAVRRQNEGLIVVNAVVFDLIPMEKT